MFLAFSLLMHGSKGVAAEAQEVVFGIHADTSFPFVQTDTTVGRTMVKGGILKELSEAFSKQLMRRPILVLIPKQRVASAVLAGKIDILCYSHESWEPDLKDQVFWTAPIFKNINFVVTINQKNDFNKLEGLFGKKVGTTVNFYYPTLEPYFNSKKILRENAPNILSNIEKLIRNRIDYLVISSLEYQYYKKIHPKIIATKLELDPVDVKCAVSKKSNITLVQINSALTKLKQSGALMRLFTIRR